MNLFFNHQCYPLNKIKYFFFKNYNFKKKNIMKKTNTSKTPKSNKVTKPILPETNNKIIEINTDYIIKEINEKPQFTESYHTEMIKILTSIKQKTNEILKNQKIEQLNEKDNLHILPKLQPINSSLKINSNLMNLTKELCNFFTKTPLGTGEILLNPKTKNTSLESENIENFEFSTYNNTGFPIMRLPTLSSRPPLPIFNPISIPTIPQITNFGVPRDLNRVQINIKSILTTNLKINNQNENLKKDLIIKDFNLELEIPLYLNQNINITYSPNLTCLIKPLFNNLKEKKL